MSQPPKGPAAAAMLRMQTAQSPEFSIEERTLLLDLARRSISAGLEGSQLELTACSPHLAEMRGAFTSLQLEGQLRGCVGYVLPVHPLYRTIAETAQAAAFGDTRFWPVTRQELPRLRIEISVLSPVQPIRAEDVVVGRHGLIITYAGLRGLLLPQVPVEHGWDRDTFLAQTCHKAGLTADAWQHGAVLEAFTAEVFAES